MYILVTPAKNEESNLYEVSESIISQSVRPVLWVIVDDGSTDQTPMIINMLSSKHNWIKKTTMPPGPRDLTHHYASVCKRGFDYAISYSAEHNIIYRYIGLLDADTILNYNYFLDLITEFDKDKSLGICSGGINYEIGGDIQLIEGFDNLPSGTGRLWRKECFFDTGGYLEKASPDSISNVKAQLRGWKTKRFEKIIAIERRKTSSAEGLIKGYKINGWMAYYLNKHPFLVFLNIIYLSIKSPYYIGAIYFYGYFLAFVNREEKIDDNEIRDYYWNKRLNEYFKDIMDIKKLFY